MKTNRDPVLLTGATGFVGSNLYPVLRRAGYDVRCATRSVERARARAPERQWAHLDINDRETLEGALSGCSAAFYLVHSVGTGADYEEREARAALNFADAAARAGLERIVYLGGVKPRTEASRHLRSRLVTGALLRGGEVAAVELRASMILGQGSASWQILRDIAVRLPVMLSPSWLRNRTEPVGIDDVTVALLSALELPITTSVCYDIPGPEILSFEECIRRVARQVGSDPKIFRVPLLTPRLSSQWLRLVTSVDYNLARELVEGMRADLLARDHSFWTLIDHPDLIAFDEAVRRALLATPAPANRIEKLVGNLYREPDVAPR
ncbi:MAG: NAD(P)H-binding protein [Bradymonadaceae bacterium]|nr:NAD(P)H-binding protein [Lujinxingiaceae bacterium]